MRLAVAAVVVIVMMVVMRVAQPDDNPRSEGGVRGGKGRQGKIQSKGW